MKTTEPTNRRTARALTLALASLALLVLVPASASAAPPPLLSQFCETGSATGECIIPRGIATDPANGNVYVVDARNNRINAFSPWGVFLRAWGWGVATGAAEAQTCGPQATPPTATCQQGLPGGGVGQFSHSSLRAVAVDSSGDVYIYESSSSYSFPNCPGPECEQVFNGNNRMQKFDSDGTFLLMRGGEVNQGGGTPSNPGNLCTAAHIANGDTCGGGTRGSGDGEFGIGTPATFDLEADGSYVAVGPGDEIYVGGAERIQRFDTAGNFVESIPLTGETVQSLAVDPIDGNLYLSRCSPANGCLQGFSIPGSKPNVLKLSPSGAILATLPVKNPRGLATDKEGNLYVVDGSKGQVSGIATKVEIRKFTAAGVEVPSFTFDDGFDTSTGIAASSACGIPGVDLFISNSDFSNSFVRAYGPPPDPTLCPPPAVAPRIFDQYGVSADATGATVKAEISSEFWPDTTYRVQYGTGKCSEGGCEKEQPLAPGSKLTKSVTNQKLTTAGVYLGDLQPNTTYHYRFVAQSSGGGPVRGVGGEVGGDGEEGTFTTFPLASAPKTDCPNQAFRGAASAPLPDCRAYELVSPPEKNGADVFSPVVRSRPSLAQAAADGQRATYSSFSSFADPQAAPVVNQYLSARGPEGWHTRSISPPRTSAPLWPPDVSPQLKAFDEGLCSAWALEDSGLALVPGAPAGVANLYRRDHCAADSAYELLTTVPPPGFGPGEIDPEFYIPMAQGFSADQTHTVLRADAQLTSNACKTPGIFQVYLVSAAGPRRLVSALPSGKATCSHSSAGTALGLTTEFRESSLHHAISADGSRVFWTDSGRADPIQGSVGSGGVESAGPGPLYVRLDATEAPGKAGSGCSEAGKACTLAISEASSSQYWDADPQGTKAIYTVGGLNPPGAELFEFDVETASSNSIAKGVTGVVGASEDLSRIYFLSTQVLSGEGQNSEGDKAVAGKRNLYLYEDGAFTFIAGLETFDAAGELKPFDRSSRVSRDGLHLAFTSREPLSDYDNTDVASGRPDAEVYLYDADPGAGVGELACVSCNPSGVRPSGRVVGVTVGVPLPLWAAARLPGWSEQLRPSRLLSADGNRLFFESFEALVPGDSNGKLDVYQWQRASGPQACKDAGAALYSPGAGGCLSLITSGQSAEDSELIDASADGSDVFFATSASLLRQDPGLIDVYDARVNGGYPPPPSPPAACEGEACQGPLSAPNDPTPASAAFEGAGNLKPEGKPRKPKPCAKGKVRKAKAKGRCVAKPKKSKKKHSKQRANDKRRAGR